MKTVRRVLAEAPLSWLLLAVPVAAGMHHARPDAPLLVFVLACVAIVPLAGLLGVATEKLAARLGEGIGGLLNATLGNAAELIIALVALRAGMLDVVKASLTGSIIGNLLLVLGVAFLAGGLRYKIQSFATIGVRTQIGMMALAAIAILVPSVFAATGSSEMASRSVAFSVVVSAVLLVVYVLSLLFLLRTHADLFRGEERAGDEEPHGTTWPVSLTVGVMAAVTLLIVWMSEILVGTVEHASAALGLSNLFVGVVVVAVVGNAAEHSTAVLVAMRNRMEMAIGIAIGSSTQIALFVAPLLVLLSLVVAPEPLTLAFSGVEVFLVLAATFVASILIVDGKSTWFTGVQLIAVYVVMAITVFAIPA
ncbi:MAG: calcium/proton exchanger [Reyranella sp.]|uniref:calcium/proton exchanger n=1 Tax=Reyranella sp. TaxID=1929291 RepID=UPI0011F8DFAE|nr:calcium/proton exchanger [Reyranella sp.]TAJ85725.1 MAG: calcium/proton exchanger [Reyranella sp.]